MNSHRRRTLWALLAALPLWAYIVYPVFAMLAESLHAPLAAWRTRSLGWDPAQSPLGAGFIAAWHDRPAREAVWGTLRLSFGTVVCGGLWGTGLALLWGRREFPGRRCFALLGYSPLLMPPLVGTVAFFRLLGEGGVAWKFLPAAADGKPWLAPFFNVLLLHTYAFGIFTYAFAAAALEHLDEDLEAAVRSLGGGRWAVFRHALWPSIRGPVWAAALLTFMAAGASFSGPYLLDNSGHYLTVEILSQQRAGERGLTAALTAMLAALSLAALPAFLYFQRSAPGGMGSTGGMKGAAGHARLPAGPWERGVRVGLSLLAALLLLAPPAMVFLTAFGDPRGWVEGVFPRRFDFSAFQKLTRNDWSALWRSVRYGAAAAGADVALALLLALALRRVRWKAALPAELAVMLAVALPGTAVAIALLSAFNAPSWLAGGAALGQSAAILILAYAIRALPLAVRPVRAALEALGPDLEQAAQGLGATRARTIGAVVLPLLRPALSAAAVLCFVTGAGEFVASELLFGPGTVPASVQINMLFRQGGPAGASALALCLMGVCAAAAGLGAWLTARASWRSPPAQKRR